MFDMCKPMPTCTCIYYIAIQSFAKHWNNDRKVGTVKQHALSIVLSDSYMHVCSV